MVYNNCYILSDKFYAKKQKKVMHKNWENGAADDLTAGMC